MRRSRILFVFGLAAALPLAACNGDGQALQSDWIYNPAPTATPAPKPAPTGTPTPTPTSITEQLYSGPAEVAKYVQKFVDDAKIQGIDVTPDMKNPTLEIQITSLATYGSSVIGLCEMGGSLRRVTFDPDFWNSVSDTQKELVVHHELGHCVLYRSHVTTLLSTGAYSSIMYPVIMPSSTYLNNYDYYQQELFTQTELSLGALIGVQTHICNGEDL